MPLDQGTLACDECTESVSVEEITYDGQRYLCRDCRLDFPFPEQGPVGFCDGCTGVFSTSELAFEITGTHLVCWNCRLKHDGWRAG